MITYFISDLHLTPERPKITQAFFKFLAEQAPQADKVYILGDLFEFWIGDDAASILGAEAVLQAMKQLSKTVDCYFIAGNRDFLVGEQFTDETGFTILSDETIIDLYGTPTLLLHGDSLCTDDIAHMQFREQMVTNQKWRDGFLSLAIPERIEQAKMARMQSHEHKTEISMEIMDVTESAVINAFDSHCVTQMIHGHTHRQDPHQHQTSSGTAVRYVLGDWHQTGSLITAKNNGSLEISNFDI